MSAEIASLQEITKIALKVQRELENLVFLGSVEPMIEPMVEPMVEPCKPCRVYTHGQEKPDWAIHGCLGTGHRSKIILQPQLPAEEKPTTKQWTSKLRQNGTGFSCVHPECRDYNKIYKGKSAAQQHAKKHYPTEYKCSACPGEWYLKTEYNQHFMKPCPHCDKLFMKGSLSGHKKNCLREK